MNTHNNKNTKASARYPAMAVKAAAKNIASILLAFLLTVLLVLTALLLTPKFALFREQFFLERMEKVGFSDALATNIEQEYASLAIPSGFPEEVMKQAVDRNALNYDLYTYVSYSLHGEEFVIDKAALQTKLNEQFLSYAKSQNAALTEEDTSNISYLSGMCADYYAKKIYFPGVKQLSQMHIRLNSMINYALTGCVFLFLLFSFLLFFIRSTKHRALRFYISTFIGAAISIGIVPLILLLIRPQDRLNIWPDYFYDFVISCIDGILWGWLVIACFCVLISFLLNFPYRMLRENNKNR